MAEWHDIALNARQQRNKCRLQELAPDRHFVSIDLKTSVFFCTSFCSATSTADKLLHGGRTPIFGNKRAASWYPQALTMRHAPRNSLVY